MALITFSSNSTAIALKAAVFGAATRQAECDLAVAGVGTGFIVKLYLGAAVRGTVTSLAPFTVGGSTDRRLIWPTFGPYAATGAPFGIVDTAEILTSAGVSLWKMPLVMGVVQDGCKPDFGPYPIVLGNPAKPIGAGNSAPTITSGATFQIYENATAIATMTATDDATGLVWSISPQVGGSNANAALFTITSGGILSFIAGQAAAVRLVRVRVTDAGGLFAEKDLTITVAVYTGSVFPIAALGSASAKSTPYTQTQLANNMGGFWQPDSITPSVVSTIAGPRVMIDAAAVTRAQAVAVAGIDARWVQLESVADAEVAMGATVLFGKSTYDNTGSWRRAQLCAAAYLAHPNASKRAAYLARVETVLAAFALSYKTSINVADGPLLAWGDTTTSTPLPGGGFCVVKDQRNIPFSDESQGYGYRDTIPILCVMLDWCYAGLSVPTRDKISALLMDWFEHMCVPAWYPAWNRNQYINWCMWPVAYFNNYWWANYGSMAMMVCAAYGRDPRTDSPNGTNRPAWGKDWIEKTWNGLMEPWFARGDGVGGKGGAASYATAYEQSSHISAIRIGWKNTFGDTTTIPATWFNEHLNWQIQRIMPGMTKRAKLGEDKRSDSFGNQQQFNWHRLLVTIHAADDATLKGQAWKLLDIAPGPWSGIPNYDATDYTLPPFLRDSAAPRSADLTGLPKALFVPGIQRFQHRDTTIDNAAGVAWSVDAGRGLTRHAGALEVYSGGWVLVNADGFPWTSIPSDGGDGLEHGSEYYSCLNIYTSDGYYIAQSYQDGGSFADIGTSPFSGTAMLWQGSSAGYGYCASQAATMYTGGNTSGSKYGQNRVILGGSTLYAPVRGYLSDWARKFVYIESLKAWVLLDRASLGNATDTLSFSWLGKGVPTISGGDTFKLLTSSTTHDIWGKYLSGAPAITSLHIDKRIGVVGSHDGASTPELGGIADPDNTVNYDLVEVKKSGAGTQRLLAVLQLGIKASSSAPNAAALITPTGHGLGALVGGTHAVIIGNAELANAPWQYEVNATNHLVTDMIPGSIVVIKRQAVGGGADLQTQNITADSAGVITFTTVAGAFRHIIDSYSNPLSLRVFNNRITTTLAARRTANTIEWQDFVADCTLKIGAPSSYPGILVHWVAVYAKMENNATHKTWVRDQVMALVAATSVAAITTGPNYNAAYGNDAHHKEIWKHICELAWSVDLCYEAFSAADRTAVAAIVNAYMDQWAKADQSNWAQLYTTDSPNVIFNPSHLINNYMQNAWFAHAVAGVGSAGWNPRAGEWLTKAHQMRTVWQDTFSLAKYPNGRETEGSYYTPYMRHGFMALWILGEADAQQYLTAAEVKAQLNMTMFHMRPNLTDMHIGAQAAVTKGWFHPNKQYAIHTYIAMLEKLSPADAIVGHAATKLAQIQIDTFTDSNDGSETGKQFYEFFWGYDQVTPTSLATKTDTYLSTKGSQAVGTNKIYGHSGWNDLVNDVAFVVFANNTFSNPVYSHANPDAPGFQWYKGADQIVCDPEYFTNNGVGAEAGDGNAGVLVNNCVLPSSWINAATRRYNTTGDSTAPVIEQELSGSAPVPYRYVRINATNYYNFTSFDAARNCAMLRRCYIWLGATYKTVLIWDRVQTTGQSKRWQIHTTGAATIAGDVATWTAGATAARLRRLHTDGAPSAITDVNLAGTNMVPGPPEGTPYEAGIRRLEYSTSADDSRFFAVLDIDGNCTAAAISGATNAGYLECTATVGGVSMTIRISDTGNLVSIT